MLRLMETMMRKRRLIIAEEMKQKRQWKRLRVRSRIFFLFVEYEKKME